MLDEWIAFRELTLEEVAERSGISKTHVTQLKSSKRAWNPRVLVKLARGLDVQDPLALFKPPSATTAVDIWSRIPPSRHTQAQRAVDHVLEGFAEPDPILEDKPAKKPRRKARD